MLLAVSLLLLQVEEFLTEQTYQQRRGPAAKELKDDQLFFVDTVRARGSGEERKTGAEKDRDRERQCKRRR